jgi:hypothetical protein
VPDINREGVHEEPIARNPVGQCRISARQQRARDDDAVVVVLPDQVLEFGGQRQLVATSMPMASPAYGCRPRWSQ